MKRIIFALLIMLLVNNSVFAQKIANDKVPTAVLSAFKEKFPAATTVSWGMENANEYEAEFKLNGEKISAIFDSNGKWLETETEIKASGLPAAIQSTLNKDFAGYHIEEASKIESLKNGNCFEAEIEKGEETLNVLFASDGKILSKTKEVEKKGDKD